ncbi:MAG: SAM-dependent chlorinase/fluorinase [Bacteroidales bacterium]|nr:SAM-dependent chlorinase/fluorinase [Bacteroidales bacterium]
MLRIVSITSDWNRQDYYSGMMKGRLSSLMPDVRLIETGNQILPFRTLEGAFIVRSILPEFPIGSIHLFLVNQGNSPDVYPMLLKTKGRYIIAWEDSVLGLVVEEKPELCLRITPDVFNKMKKLTGVVNGQVAPSFPELGLFPIIALSIVLELPLAELGPDQSDIVMNSPWLPVIQDKTLVGRVIYIDSYGNAISNISKDLFDRANQGKRFEIYIISNHYRLDRINTGYMETEPGDMLALFNAINYLEFAIVHGNISDLLGLETGSTIKIKFYD